MPHERLRGDEGRARATTATRSAASSATSCARSCSERTRLVYENADFVVVRALRAQVPVRDLDPAAHATAAHFEDCAATRIRQPGQRAHARRAAQAAMWRSTTRPTTSSCTRRRSAKAIAATTTGTSRSCRRLTQVAGFEWGSGFYINPTPPEEAAKFLREIDGRDAHPARRLRGRALLQDRRPRRRARRAAARAGGARPRGHRGDAALPLDRSRALRPGAPAARAGRAARRRHRRCRRLRRASAVDAARARLSRRSPAVVRSRRALRRRATATTPTTRAASRCSARRRWRWRAELGAWPDVVHGHDWQAGPALLYAQRRWGDLRPPKTVFTIHNLAYQGLFPESVVDELGLPPSNLQPRRLRVLRAGSASSRPGWRSPTASPR